MINIETHRVVDMVYTRESAEVAEWLKTYPNIEVVSRDGSTLYANAIRSAHPNAIQVSDRFHLIKGLTDAARQFITRFITSRIRIESASDRSTGAYWEKQPKGPDLPERLHNATTEKRAVKLQRIRELAAQGLTIGRISKETGAAYTTIKKYLDKGFGAEFKEYGVSYPSKLKPFTTAINEMLTQRKTFREIEEAIRAVGYNGAASTIRMYATRKRRHDQEAHGKSFANTEIIERKWLLKLLYTPIEKIKGITEAQLEKVLRDYPILGEVYAIVQSFKGIVFAKRVTALDGWMESAKKLASDDINSFLNGLSHDIVAVKNAIIYDYNNGLAEGSINKIKVYKRIMFGRNSFELLRSKTLLLERRPTVN